MFWNELLEMLLPIVAAGLTALIGFAIAYLRKETEKINNNLIREAVDAALAEAHIVAEDAVMATKQVLVDNLRDENGKLSPENAEQALAQAREYFLAHLTENSKGILLKSIGSFESWVIALLESKVGKQNLIEQKVRSLANPH